MGSNSSIWKKAVREQFKEWGEEKHRGAFEKRVEVVRRHVYGKRVIDIGAGDGEMLSRLRNDFLFYGVGVDLCDNFRDRNSFDFALADAEYLPFREEAFECAIMTATLEHISDHKKALDEANRVLVGNGRLLITSPNPRFDFFFRILGKLRLKFPEGKENKVSLERIVDLVVNSGFEIQIAEYFLMFVNQFVLAKKRVIQ